MMLPLEIEDSDKILIIAPHPDDESIGMGGLLARYAKQSTVIVISDGGEGVEGVAHEKVSFQRKKEFETVMKKINIKEFRLLGFPDGCLMMHPECMDTIDFSEYDKIFIPWGDDDHPDHAAVNHFALTVMRKQHIVAEVFQYEVHCPFHTPDMFLDITDVLDKKAEMIRVHISQLAGRCYPEIAISLAKYRASQANQPEKAYECYLRTDIDSLVEQGTIEFLNREKEIAKYKMFYQIVANIARLQKRGYTIADYLCKKDYNRVSVYGFGYLGRLLVDLLENTNIFLVEVIDKRIINTDRGISIVQLAEANKNVDAVIVTAIGDYEIIKKELFSKGYHQVYSLTTLSDDMMETLP